jgi:hypothetical protein
VSVAAPTPTITTPVDAACPLCGAPLDPAQEWCLSCGAAARTRLAAPTNWKAPIVAIAVIVTLALGVLAAALVKLSGGSETTKAVAPVTTTITATTPVFPGASTTAATTAPSAVTGIGGAAAPTTTGAVTPGTPTTIAPGSSPAAPTGGATATSTTPTGTSTGTSRATEEALRKAGFETRIKK